MQTNISTKIRFKFFNLILSIIFLLTNILLPQNIFKVRAAQINYFYDTVSISQVNATNVTHSLKFKTVTTSDIQQIKIRFSTTQGGTTKPVNLGLGSVDLASNIGLGSGWTLDSSDSGNGVLIASTTSGVRLNTDDEITLNLSPITNSKINDCQPTDDTLTDICFIRLSTYSDAGISEVDSGDTTYTVFEDPLVSFDMIGVPGGETHNGITSTNESTSTLLGFDHITPGIPKYITHKLTISTNAPHGYKIYAYLEPGFYGTYTDGKIDPFGGTEATWTTPQLWEAPFGDTANHNTGWIGANTTDTRVNGWQGSTTSKFGPFSSVPRLVAQSDVPDRIGSTIYVSYAIEVNGMQPADLYTGSIIYDVQTNY